MTMTWDGALFQQSSLAETQSTLFFIKASSTYLSGTTPLSGVFTEPSVTSNSLVMIIVSGTSVPKGQWSVKGGTGNFTITSTSVENNNINFDYFIIGA